MTIETTRFGSVTVDPKSVITMPKGLLGFPDARRFCLLDHAPGKPFQWLQSLEDPSLAFLITDPLCFFPEYEVEISGEDARIIGVRNPENALVLTTITVRQSPTSITANLLGPLVIDTKTRKAVQVVLDGDKYSSRMPLPQSNSQVEKPILQSAA